MDERDIIKNAIFNSNRNIFISGAGGTGKSYMLKEIINEARDKGIVCEMTAATGVAAVNVSGTTLHRFFGVGLCTGDIEYIIGKVKKNRDALMRIMNTKLLFIDEISMIGDKLFAKLDLVAKHYRKSREPFGGMRLVVSGDFLQLCPIEEGWVFESKVWKLLNFKTCFMFVPRRFTDKDFYHMLMRAREGKLIQEDLRKIKTRVDAYNRYTKEKKPEAVKPTILSALRIEVEEINKQEMEKLASNAKNYTAIDTFVPIQNTARPAHYRQQLDYMAPKVLSLKVDAQVMITWNLNVKEELCNGTRAVVKELCENTVTILTRNGQSVILERNVFPLKDKNAKVSRSQFPLMLAFAGTIHKAQGSTLDFCVVDLGPDVFAPGQGYVALSRARSWDSLLISSFTCKSIKADQKALDFITKLEDECEEDLDQN
jgi:ATP-dependent DNA helicase PIF1